MLLKTVGLLQGHLLWVCGHFQIGIDSNSLLWFQRKVSLYPNVMGCLLCMILMASMDTLRHVFL